MKIDYSFPEIFYGYYDKKNTLEDLLSHPVTTFFTDNNKNFQKTLTENNEVKKNQGFENVFHQKEQVLVLLNKIYSQEKIWLKEIKEVFSFLFPNYSLEGITVFFSLGSPTVVDTKHNILINLNESSPIHNYKEIISTIIYKITHLFYIKKHPYRIAPEHLQPASYIDFLHYLIHYKGACAYSVEFYRKKHGLASTDPLDIQTASLKKDIFTSYTDLSRALADSPATDLENLISKTEIPYKLGYQLFEGALLSEKKFYDIVSMPFPYFIKKHLTPFLPHKKDLINISHLSEEEAKEICNWRYPEKYSVYNLPPWDEMVKQRWAITFPIKRKNEFLGFYIEETLIGFGQIVKTLKGLNIGIGLRPDLCGKGYGEKTISLLINKCHEDHAKTPITLEVISLNSRAIKCYENFGFKEIKRYKNINLLKNNEFIKMEFKPNI